MLGPLTPYFPPKQKLVQPNKSLDLRTNMLLE